jgi:hypothetical protein
MLHTFFWLVWRKWFWDGTGLTSHSAFSIQHSAFSIQHSAFSIQHSAFSIQHSAFSIQHSAFSIRASFYLKVEKWARGAIFFKFVLYLNF